MSYSVQLLQKLAQGAALGYIALGEHALLSLTLLDSELDELASARELDDLKVWGAHCLQELCDVDVYAVESLNLVSANIACLGLGSLTVLHFFLLDKSPWISKSSHSC